MLEVNNKTLPVVKRFEALAVNGRSTTNTTLLDLGIAWEWEYDAGFVDKLKLVAEQHQIQLGVLDPGNIAEYTANYLREKLAFRYFLDRGSDARREFEPLAHLVANDGTRVINHYRHLKRSLDKATMHLEFITAGLNVPYTIILSPYQNQPEIKITDLARLGRSFIIKPAVGGGGTGVVVGAETLAEVLTARQSQGDQKFLLQEKVEPVLLNGERAWFRVYYVFGQTFLSWWNDITHIYRYVEPKQENQYYLSPMRAIITKIAKISQLDFFSAEIALTTDGRFVVVDYVNDICDMRLQSLFWDGVPDRLVDEIVFTLISFVAANQLKRIREIKRSSMDLNSTIKTL